MKRVILLCLLIHCSITVSFGQGAKTDSSVKQYFSEQEITQLNKLLLSFEEQIGRITGKQGDERYWSYLAMDSMYVARKLDYDSYRIPPKEATRMLYALDSSLFNKMFAYSYEVDLDTKERKSRSVSPKVNGAYVQLGKTMGETNKLWHSYFDAVSSAGDISPSATTMLPRAARQYVDLGRFNDRLSIAFHYLLSMAPQENV